MEGPVRFRCPPEFEAAPPGGTLGGPNSEIWLIRAPADLCPHSLDGCAVPLAGGGQLRPPQDGAPEGPPQLYGVRGGPGGAGAPLLLLPPPLRCAPLRGCISIARRFGDPPRLGDPPRGTAAPPGPPPAAGAPPGGGSAGGRSRGDRGGAPCVPPPPRALGTNKGRLL
ncbi:DNA-directed RNA polymerase I subunit RPA34 [Patagioenas fasciata]|uniref:DNA-directed RNA polymerase I subunit RPA34 n=1 Tax=Patagioenas fasciata TaxID=372321 RepID=UPI0032E8A119